VRRAKQREARMERGTDAPRRPQQPHHARQATRTNGSCQPHSCFPSRACGMDVRDCGTALSSKRTAAQACPPAPCPCCPAQLPDWAQWGTPPLQSAHVRIPPPSHPLLRCALGLCVLRPAPPPCLACCCAVSRRPSRFTLRKKTHLRLRYKATQAPWTAANNFNVEVYSDRAK